jgi:Na+-driven multidrug efflux pump
MALLTLLLAWILLPILGIVGAGWAFLIAQTVGSLVAITELIFTRNRLQWIDKPAVKITSLHADERKTVDEPAPGY